MARKPTHTQLDHRGDPEPRDAAAPTRTVTGTGRTLLDAHRAASGAGPRTAETRTTDAAELMRRVRAAVACEVPRGKHGDNAARDECEGHLLAELVAEARRESGGKTPAPRTERTRMGYLRWRARDWRRAEDRRRGEVLPADLATQDLAGRPGEDADAAPQWEAPRARAGARALCALLGLSVAGTIETALYAYLRGDDASTADIARETGMTPDAARQALSRGRALIRAAYPDPGALLDALCLVDRADAGSPVTVSRRTRARVKQYRRDSWRDDAAALPAAIRECGGHPSAGHAVIAYMDAAERRETARAEADAGRHARRAAILNPAHA